MPTPCILVKTGLGMERMVAARIEELGFKAEASPEGFKGLVLVYGCRDPEGDARRIEGEVVEADRVLPLLAEAPARLEEMARVAAELARDRIVGGECFAVRTVRRGRHPFTSMDVNVVVGDAVRRATEACVNLSFPDKVVAVEIIQDKAYITVYPGALEWRKMKPGKNPLYRLYRRIAVVQMPYLGPLDASRNMGVRIGREIQNFEVRELVVAPSGIVRARELYEFLGGLFEGIESRYQIQARSYHRRVERVPVYVQDIHQLVRDRRGEPIIVLEPEGEHISKVADELWRLIKRGGRINVMVGSREGIPLGIYRFADLVIDIAPGITLSTEYAAAAALIAMGTLLHEKLGELGEGGDTSGGEGGEAQAPN